MFAFQDARGPVEVGFTDRDGGPGGAASLDLADRALETLEGRRDLDTVLDAFVGAGQDAGQDDRQDVGLRRAVRMRQVHGADVHVVDETTREPPVGDALVTAAAGVALIVRVADCVPVLLADPAAGVLAAVHAGRPGLAAGVVPATLRVMRELGAGTVDAWVGPHVCGSCYEVPAPMRAEVAVTAPASWSETSWGTPSLDLGAGVAEQLRAGGVEDVREVARCTLEDDHLHSYRRDGDRSGRLAGVVWRRP